MAQLDSLRNSLENLKAEFKNKTEDDGMTAKLPPNLPPYGLFGDAYKLLLRHGSKPRPDRDPLMKKKERKRTPWSEQNGIFYKGFARETPKLIDDCFEWDWEQMKKVKYKNSEEKDVKELMRKYYPLLKECYKFEAGQGTTGSTFGVTMNQIISFCDDLHFFDKNFKIADADRFFITVNSSTTIKNNPMVPKNSMIRF